MIRLQRYDRRKITGFPLVPKLFPVVPLPPPPPFLLSEVLSCVQKMVLLFCPIEGALAAVSNWHGECEAVAR